MAGLEGHGKRDGFFSKRSTKGFLLGVAGSVFLSVRSHSTSSIEYGLEKGMTASRRPLLSSRRQKGGSGRNHCLSGNNAETEEEDLASIPGLHLWICTE